MKITVVGFGALGTKLVEKLRNVKVIDRDFVEEANLGAFFKKKDLGKPKALLAKRLGATPIVEDLNYSTIKHLDGSDIIIDCTDNMNTRYLLNEYCVKNDIPFIYGGVVSSQGMSALFQGRPCFQCLFPKKFSPELLDTCETRGVSEQAINKVVDYQIRQIDCKNPGELFHFNRRKEGVSKIRSIKDCPVCSKKQFDMLNGKGEVNAIQLCGKDFQITADIDLKQLHRKYNSRSKLIGDIILHIDIDGKRISAFSNRAIIKGCKTKEEATSFFLKVIGNY